MNYYQQPNPTVNINPFQQNVDIIKNFFRKPIVLINTIFETITIPITIFLLFSLSSLATTSLYNELYSNFYYDKNFYNISSLINVLGNFILIVGIIACIPAVLSVIAKFLIYFKSKNSAPNANPSAGFTILWVLSIISVCCMGILCSFFALIMIIGIFTSASFNDVSYYSSYNYSYSSTATTVGFVILLIFYLIIFGVMFFYLINQLRFYSSVRKSLNGIYLRKNGAMIFGVFRIIGGFFSCLNFLIYFIALISTASISMPLTSNQSIPINILAILTLLLGLSGGSGLTGGIIAVKYSGYIKSIVTGINQQFNANLPYSNPVPVTPLGDNAYAQPQPQQTQNNSYSNTQSENPYANPQQINPHEPQEPVSDNQCYKPVENPAAQEETAPTESDANKNVCPNCGSPVFISDMFCNNCGTKLK